VKLIAVNVENQKQVNGGGRKCISTSCLNQLYEGRLMETVLSRAGIWLVALFLAILATAGAHDTPFAIHMGMFALAALLGSVALL
jgi:hypothetical protein